MYINIIVYLVFYTMKSDPSFCGKPFTKKKKKQAHGKNNKLFLWEVKNVNKQSLEQWYEGHC